jgi:hypothetical protein
MSAKHCLNSSDQPTQPCNLLLLLLPVCSALSSVTELHLAYKAPSQPCTPAPNLTADSAAWAQLHLRQLSLADLAVPAAVLQQLANLPGGGLSSLELSNCKVESSPRQVAKVLAGGWRVEGKQHSCHEQGALCAQHAMCWLLSLNAALHAYHVPVVASARWRYCADMSFA